MGLIWYTPGQDVPFFPINFPKLAEFWPHKQARPLHYFKLRDENYGEGILSVTSPLALVCPECLHCRRPTPEGSASAGPYCCEGCRAVHALILNLGLSDYYKLQKQGNSIGNPLTLETAWQKDRYAFIDDPEFLSLYSEKQPNETRRMKFFVEGVHCTACLWLIERLPQFVPGVRTVRLDLGSSLLRVDMFESSSFASVAHAIHDLGYRPHPIRENEDEEMRAREDRVFLARLGIAAVCAGNLMLLAVSLYSGVNGSEARPFRLLSLALYIPVVFFSATPFYKSAWNALRTRTLSIDVPLSLAIVVGSLVSTWNLARGTEHFYFDTLAVLVFLLLSSRYVLKRTQRNALRSAGLMHFLTPSTTRRVDKENKCEELPVSALKPGDIVEVRPGENIPVDGEVVAGTGALNCALLTGESCPVSVGPGNKVFAGTVNEEAVLQIKVSAHGSGTRLGAILAAAEDSAARRTPVVALADRRSRTFVWAVLGLAPLAFLLGTFSMGSEEGLHRALALIIITCPCALALATPLAVTLSLGRAAKLGLLIKGGDTLERLASIRRAFLDKTGTITFGEYRVVQWIRDASLPSGEIERAVLALEARSNHPVAHALVAYLRGAGFEMAATENPSTFREKIGSGVEGIIDGTHFSVRASQEESIPNEGPYTTIGVFRDGIRVATAQLGDTLRPDSVACIDRLRTLGIRPHLLSGDSWSAVSAVAQTVGIPLEDCKAAASPEEKAKVVEGNPAHPGPPSMMAGDGANDAIALGVAAVGIAVHGGMEVSLRAADVYSSRPGLAPLCDLVELSRETLKVIHRNFAFSLIYNIGGIIASLAGWVNPFFAAVLMPISALTVFVSSIQGTRRMRNLSRGPRT